MQTQKPTIGIYMPSWLCRSDKSDQMFLDELVRVIKLSNRYRPLLLNLPRMWFFSEKNAQKFVQKNNLVAIVNHDSAFYGGNSRYARNVKFLERFVPFFNSTKSHELGHDKITTMNLLRERNIPVLDCCVIDSVCGLDTHFVDGEMYVVKPHDKGGGTGVKLIKKHDGKLFGHHKGQWRDIEIIEKVSLSKGKGVKIKHSFESKLLLLLWDKFNADFEYYPMLVEPYFNNHNEGFSSLRCTVVGNEVVESVKRTNYKKITSNISAGGCATKIELSDSQKKAAVDATKAIGADYAGVDFLIRGDEWVIGEVNIGPFTLFSKCTGVNVRKIFGEYLMNECDRLG